MAILSEPGDCKDNPAKRVDLDYDDVLSDAEAAQTAAINYEIPLPPPGISVTIHLDDKHNQLKKIHSQKRNTKHSLTTQRCQQLGDSFGYSNSDLHNVINIGRDARTVIINRRNEDEEVEVYSPTSNYRLPDNYEYNSWKRHNISTVPPPTKQSKTNSALQKLHVRCFLHPKAKHSSF